MDFPSRKGMGKVLELPVGCNGKYEIQPDNGEILEVVRAEWTEKELSGTIEPMREINETLKEFLKELRKLRKDLR